MTFNNDFEREAWLRLVLGEWNFTQADTVIEEMRKREPEEPCCDVWLRGFDYNQKISAIKAIRTVTGLGLQEAKNCSESLPFKVGDHVSMDRAREIRGVFKELSLTVEVRTAK